MKTSSSCALNSMTNFDAIRRRERARFYLSFVTTETASLRMIGLLMPRRAERVLGGGLENTETAPCYRLADTELTLINKGPRTIRLESSASNRSKQLAQFTICIEARQYPVTATTSALCLAPQCGHVRVTARQGEDVFMISFFCGIIRAGQSRSIRKTLRLFGGLSRC
jgi:hypothetical protein